MSLDIIYVLFLALLTLHIHLPGTKGCPCITSCGESLNGNFQSCDSCDTYISCSWGNLQQMPCSTGSKWDDNAKNCLPNSTTCPCPTASPEPNPTRNPTKYPTRTPTKYPTRQPTQYPTINPTEYPTKNPTEYPTRNPTQYPASKATPNPTPVPTRNPSLPPTIHPSLPPTLDPTDIPMLKPTTRPTAAPTSNPTVMRNERKADEPQTTNMNDQNNNDDNVRDDLEEAPMMDENALFIIIGSILAFIIIIICCSIWIHSKTKENTIKQIESNLHENTDQNVENIQYDDCENNNTPKQENPVYSNVTNLSCVNNILVDDVIGDMLNEGKAHVTKGYNDDSNVAEDNPAPSSQRAAADFVNAAANDEEVIDDMHDKTIQ